MSQDEYKFYELAQEELENNPNKGLLIKLGIECDDDKKKVRVRYIETRVEHMKAEYAAAKNKAEEKAGFDVVLTYLGGNKIAVIK